MKYSIVRAIASDLYQVIGQNFNIVYKGNLTTCLRFKDNLNRVGN
jgi:hypothetical protein